MMKNQTIFALICLITLAGCNLDPHISERDYPIIRTLGSSEVNQTGASIDFEIVKESKSTITSYGVEYFDLSQPSVPYPEWVFTEEISGKPSGNLGKVRLQYDLLKNENYIAVPFVRISGKTVYGEPTTFTSLGTKAPIINEISVTRLSGNHHMTIKGDFFSYENRFLSLGFSGLEEFFRFNIESVSPRQIEVFVELISSLYSSDKKYDFTLSVNGQETVVKDAFEIGLPRILSVSPLELNVGDTFQFELDIEADANFLDHAQLVDETGTGTMISLEELSATHFRSSVPNIRAGNYTLTLGAGLNGQIIYENPLSVKNNWVQASEAIPDPEPTWRFNYLASRNELYAFASEYFNIIYRLDLQTGQFLKITSLLPAQIGRLGTIFSFDEDTQSFYYGLGKSYNQQTSNWEYPTDFYRFTLGTGKWETLASLPGERAEVRSTFHLNGKIMAVIFDKPNFLAFDTKAEKWEDTGWPVPQEFLGSKGHVERDGKIYFVTKSYGTLSLFVFSPGSSANLLATMSVFEPSFDPKQSIAVLGTSLFLSNGSMQLWEYDLTTQKSKVMQLVSAAFNRPGKFYVFGEQLYFGTEKVDTYNGELTLYRYAK